jgi:hypothetical protein
MITVRSAWRRMMPASALPDASARVARLRRDAQGFGHRARLATNNPDRFTNAEAALQCLDIANRWERLAAITSRFYASHWARQIRERQANSMKIILEPEPLDAVLRALRKSRRRRRAPVPMMPMTEWEVDLLAKLRKDAPQELAMAEERNEDSSN